MILAEIVGWEFLLVLLLAALVFGSSQLPKLARSLGSARREFEKGLSEGGQKDTADAADTATPAATAAPAAPAAPADAAPPPPPAGGEQVTLTRAELDALIADREAKARGQQSS